MAWLDVGPDALTVRFGRWEHIGGLLRDTTVPRSAVRSARTTPDGPAEVRGLRLGYRMPGHAAIGRWYYRGGRDLVAVYAGRPAVVITLASAAYNRLLLTVEDPEIVVTALRSPTP